MIWTRAAPAMQVTRAFVAALLLWSPPCAANLYRWVDPESGSIKFSSYPPPWFGNPELERHSPKVERLFQEGVANPVPVQAAAAPAASSSLIESLQARLKELLKTFTVLPASTDFDRAGTGLQQQLDTYKALSAELDRIDPKGAERRRAESQPLLDRLMEGLKAQFSPKPPGSPAGR